MRRGGRLCPPARNVSCFKNLWQNRRHKLISERTEIACSIADDADSCVANGCGRSLQWISSMQEGTINLARRKLMKEQ